MSFLFAQPEMLGAAATDLASIGSAISTANAAAAAATTRVLAAGADEVSAAVAALFSGHAQTYQALSTQAAAFHQQIVQTLTSTAGAYASAEAANVEQQLLGAINAPTMALLGRPLIGHGADGAPGTGQAGGAGGILYGNGGNGARCVDRVRRVVTDRDSGAGALARHPLAGRRTDPQLAAFYHRLMTTQRHCHTQATIAVACKLAERTRVTITTGRPYQLRDTNGDPVTARGAKELIDAHYHVDTRTHPHNRAHTDTMQNSKPAR